MTHPLELTYNWRTPIMVSSVGLFVCITVVASQQAPGWILTIGILVGCWVALLAVVWCRTRAFLQVNGPTLTVRRFHGKHVVSGGEVTAVRRVRTLTGPGYRLTVGDAHHVVAASLLQDGTVTLLRWLVEYAPGATLDPATAAAADRLRT